MLHWSLEILDANLGTFDQCSDAGNWFFSGRKWINPADPDGHTKLELHHNNLCLLYPAFAAACTCNRFVEAVRQQASTDVQAMEVLPQADRTAPPSPDR
jgi:hypothetical protein